MNPLTQRKRDDDDDAFDERGILKDGAHYTVPMKLIDSWGRDVHFEDTVPPIRDGDGRPLCQPGFARAATTKAADSARAARRAAYDAYDQTIGEQWRNPPSGAGSHGFVGAREGDLCTLNGEAAYAEYQHFIQNAWRNP
jgi:hypothetical protein